MQKMTLFLLSLCYCSTLLTAQSPASNPDFMCNNAGSIQIGPIVGQSNDPHPDTIFLCHKDSFFVDHLGNATFAGDPISATQSGVVYGFYTARPQSIGPNLQTVLMDSIVRSSTNPQFPKLAVGNQSGDIWMTNTGSLLMFPNQDGARFWFAPLTIDNFAALAYENGGPCVHVNTAAAFQVVFLEEIKVSSPTLDPGKCQGKFRITGGLPAFDQSQSYQPKFYKKSDPSEKGVLRTSNLKHNTIIEFSVNSPGIYTLEVEDGKSCGVTTEFDMTACDTTGVLNYTISDTIVKPWAKFCVPITVRNFNVKEVITTSFSLNWDPTVLRYKGVSSTLSGFNPSTDVSVFYANNGNLGFNYLNASPVGSIVLNEDSSILNVCFEAIGVSGQDAELCFSGNPTKANTYNSAFTELHVVFHCGNIGIRDSTVLSAPETGLGQKNSLSIYPNPAEERAYLHFADPYTLIDANLEVYAANGKLVSQKRLEVAEGQTDIAFETRELTSGWYFVCVRSSLGVWMGKLVIR
jgi:hypothetical protein